jgi:choline transport protein
MLTTYQVLPRAMVSSALINYITALVFVITLVSGVGGDLATIVSTPSGQPWVALVQQVTGSQGATIAFICIVAFQFTFCAINEVTTSSRQLWAFARGQSEAKHDLVDDILKICSRQGRPIPLSTEQGML